ncbi:MAG: relaxase/mobilization nuclease domain-containing protein [Qipengyuania pacifica]
MADDELDVRPGRSRDSGARTYRRADTLVGRVLQVSRRSGYTALGRSRSGGGTGHMGRGRRAALQRRRSSFQRRVVIKARIVRHKGARFRSAPLARHIAYLERDGVTRDGSDGHMFDARTDHANGETFAGRCEEDRHHFRFIVSPEDASDMADLRAFTREMMEDMARDLDTSLDWVAVDHWNTDHPHIHVLVRGVASDGKDLVIDRAYMSEGLRARAEERATIELGPRSERDIQKALRREVDAERWTSLDRRLQRQLDDERLIDLRPERQQGRRTDRTLLIGRARALESMKLAERVGPATWRLAVDVEPALRALGERGDIIKTMHRAMSGQALAIDPSRLAVHGGPSDERIVGRLVERGHHDELTGEAYAIVDGVDGRTHHLRYPDLERTSDAVVGAIVEASGWTDRKGRMQSSLLVRSDLALEDQIHARGATWLDRQLVGPGAAARGGGFGMVVETALSERTDILIGEGLASRQGQRIVYAKGLLDTLRKRDLAQASEALARRHGSSAMPVRPGDFVSGIYRERIPLASGRFAMIDNGMGFHLVPWRQDLERHLGEPVSGKINVRGGVDWSFSRARGLAR